MGDAIGSKVKVIEYRDGRSLADLDLNPGDWVGFYNRDIDITSPFVIAKARSKLAALSSPSRIKGMLVLSQVTHPGQNFSLETEGEVIGLDDPFTVNCLRFPNIAREVTRYAVEYAYVGKDNIVAGLSQVPELGIYVDWLKGEFARLK